MPGCIYISPSDHKENHSLTMNPLPDAIIILHATPPEYVGKQSTSKIIIINAAEVGIKFSMPPK